MFWVCQNNHVLASSSDCLVLSTSILFLSPILAIIRADLFFPMTPFLLWHPRLLVVIVTLASSTDLISLVGSSQLVLVADEIDELTSHDS